MRGATTDIVFMESGQPAGGTWLCPTELDRARMLDMLRRSERVATFLIVTGVAVVLLVATRVGPLILIPFSLHAVMQGVITHVHPRRARPEYWLFAAEVITVACATAGLALSNGARGPLVVIFAFPLVLSTGRYSPRGARVLTALCLLGVVVGELLRIDRGHQLDAICLPAVLILLSDLAVASWVMSGAEREHREQSLLDPLTGVLNRLALAQRFEEVRQQAATSGAEVCLIAADLDHFKAINDTLGHDVGDTVLRDVAYALRTNTRAFSLLYRIGGEEFVILLPGLTVAQGAAIAERLRLAVEGCKPSGAVVTMSFGVASAAGRDVDFERLFARADACLYQAKSQGRNRVVPAPAGAAVAEPATVAA